MADATAGRLPCLLFASGRTEARACRASQQSVLASQTAAVGRVKSRQVKTAGAQTTHLVHLAAVVRQQLGHFSKLAAHSVLQQDREQRGVSAKQLLLRRRSELLARRLLASASPRETPTLTRQAAVPAL